MDEHVILVAFTVEAETRQRAQRALMSRGLPSADLMSRPGFPVTEWWIAEDVRFDRSDNEAAVFVPEGMTTYEARMILEWAVANKAEVLEAYAATLGKEEE